MSRIEATPVVHIEDPPTLVGATLAFSASLVLAPIGGVIVLPWAAGRWCGAIRAMHRGRWRPGRTIASGLALLLVVIAPMLVALATWLSAPPDRGLHAAQVIGPLGLALLLVPLFVRLPLVLAQSTRVTLRDAAASSIAYAIAAPLETARLTALLLAAFAATVGLGVACASLINTFAAVLVAIAALPVALTAVMWRVSSRMPAEPPEVQTRMLGVLASLFGLPFLLLAIAGVLATTEARPVTVIRDGEGRQLVRGLLREEGPRGVLRAEQFTVTSGLREVVVEPGSGERYEVSARYSPQLARMDEAPCEGWRARLQPGCRRITMRGPDWEMELVVDATGARLDDDPLARAFERLGVSGVTALLVAMLVLAAMLLAVARLRRRARHASGADRPLRLAGVLELEEDGRLEPSGLLTGSGNRVVLREGGLLLRLPQRLRAVGVARASLKGAQHRHEVLVACDQAPGMVTHRTADAPWPIEAALVIGDVAAIEAESIAAAGRVLSGYVLGGSAIGAVALVVLALA